MSIDVPESDHEWCVALARAELWHVFHASDLHMKRVHARGFVSQWVDATYGLDEDMGHMKYPDFPVDETFV
ncbi:MAG: hypothetical protein AAF978_09370, partial [Cyanobacteria bacterium P01_E01_bin.48]